MRTRSVWLLCGLALLSGCATQPEHRLKTVDHVDLNRYMGTWHVMANIPNFLTSNKVATADEYHRRPDGDINVTYHFRKGFDDDPDTWHGKAWLPDPNDASRWKVRLLWPFTSDYRILALDSDYRYVMVGTPSRDLLWIMSRKTTMPEAVYNRYVQRAEQLGFPVNKLRRMPQTASDVGKPGYK